MRRRIRTRVRLGVVLVSAGLLVGCESDQQPTAADRSEQALRDPMNYKADFSKSRVSSGTISSFDKDGFKRDMDRVFNP